MNNISPIATIIETSIDAAMSESTFLKAVFMAAAKSGLTPFKTSLTRRGYIPETIV